MIGADAIAAARRVNLPALISTQVRLSRQGRTWCGCCPFHPDSSPSFVVYEDHYHCFGCGAHGDAADWLARTRGLTFPDAVRELLGGIVAGPPLPAVQHPAVRDAIARQRRIAQARRIWDATDDAADTPVQTYLQHRLQRRLADLPTVLRYHPACPRGPRRADRLPAIVALMFDPVTGRATGIHRTYLRLDGHGKAPIDKPKMMLGTAGMVRLAPAEAFNGQLAVAEGIETAMAVTHILRAGPCWAALSTEGLRRLPVLFGFHALRIFADPDGPGLAAAEACRDRWQRAGRHVVIFAPPAGSGDWLDHALAEGW